MCTVWGTSKINSQGTSKGTRLEGGILWKELFRVVIIHIHVKKNKNIRIYSSLRPQPRTIVHLFYAANVYVWICSVTIGLSAICLILRRTLLLSTSSNVHLWTSKILISWSHPKCSGFLVGLRFTLPPSFMKIGSIGFCANPLRASRNKQTRKHNLLGRGNHWLE